MLARYVVNPKDHHEASAALAGQSHTRPNFARGVAGWVLFIGLCGIVFVLLAQKPRGRGDTAMPPPPAEPPATLHFKIGMGMIVGGGVLLVVGWFVLLPRLRLRSRPYGQTVMVDEVADGLSFTTPEFRVELPWGAFDGFLETPGLFVLRHPGNMVRTIPKAAFDDKTNLDRFAQSLRAHVRDLRSGAGP
jgi:hypothetical protein